MHSDREHEPHVASIRSAWMRERGCCGELTARVVLAGQTDFKLRPKEFQRHQTLSDPYVYRKINKGRVGL